MLYRDDLRGEGVAIPQGDGVNDEQRQRTGEAILKVLGKIWNGNDLEDLCPADLVDVLNMSDAQREAVARIVHAGGQ